MFERRVKIFLLVMALATVVLLARAMQIQVLERSVWASKAVGLMSDEELIETTRGRLLDRKLQEIAVDEPCIDACVDYRAVSTIPDETWLRNTARGRLRMNLGTDYSAAPLEQRKAMLDAEMKAVQNDIDGMWKKLAELGGYSPEEMTDLRQSILWKVESRRRFVWYAKYRDAMKDQEGREPSPWYQNWLLDDSQQVPKVDQFYIEVAEQFQPHVILPHISPEVNNVLAKNREKFPGLVLRPSMYRKYPFNEVGAHLIGRIGKVAQEDLAADVKTPNGSNSLRRYWRNDLIGQTGLEKLCEPLLRGTRGRIEKTGDNDIIASTPPLPGADVRTTIDIRLQRQIQQIFEQIEISSYEPPGEPGHWNDTLAMPGAAVVLDVASNDVLAMVSYPSYDLNSFDEEYPSLVQDVINRPLSNRATQVALEPGSTVKPIVGLGAITQGLIGVNDTIECTGYLVLGGRKYGFGRCWTMSMFNHGHHAVPSNAPHPTGHLTFDDAVERSCNVYFETLADRLGTEGLRYWFDKFGLGRRTGIGIAEYAGRIPRDVALPPSRRRAAAWFSGIGQDQVLATPLQMAGVAATIARNGIWMRPRLVAPEVSANTPASQGPDRVDLRLNPAAVAKAKEGMIRVVNTPYSGTGTSLYRQDMMVAGKTGSAQAGPLKIKKLNEHGQLVTVKKMMTDKDGRTTWVDTAEPVWEELRLGTHANPNPKAPWYRGTGALEDKRSHAWFIGYAPAENPKVAFAVMVEYGGSGGATAGFVAKQMLDACVEHGYLPKR